MKKKKAWETNPEEIVFASTQKVQTGLWGDRCEGGSKDTRRVGGWLTLVTAWPGSQGRETMPSTAKAGAQSQGRMSKRGVGLRKAGSHGRN